LVILLVSVSYFAGLSLGYALAGHIPRGWLMPLGVATLVLHLTLPIWFRLLVAAFEALHAYALAFLVLPLLTPFVISAFYSIFLPLFADDGQGELPALYALELLGSACGVLVLVLLGGIGLQAIYSIYALGLLAILLALGLKGRWLIPLALVSILWLALLPAADAWSNALWYEALQGLPAGTKTLFSGYSPYQKVDVLEAPDGSRYLYLDGLNHFGTSDGSRLNVIMGQIPASITHPQNAVVFGAGSMQMEALIADYAGQVTTVEIDPLVVNVSQQFFLPFNHMDTLTNRRIIVDDAKHFIANTDQTFDMAATDLPAAYSIQTATLYSAPFFRAVADHLSPNGVFSVNLTSPFSATNEISRRIAAGLLANFKDVVVVTPASAGWSFAYASDNLPFDRAALENALHDTGEENFIIFDTPAVRAFVGDAQPITLDSMDVVLKVSSSWVSARLRGQ
jgi:spermidine synthase